MEAGRHQTKKTVSREIQNTEIWLQALEGEQDRMTEWEKGFVENMFDAFEQYGSLTPRQYETLEKIYRKIF